MLLAEAKGVMLLVFPIIGDGKPKGMVPYRLLLMLVVKVLLGRRGRGGGGGGGG